MTPSVAFITSDKVPHVKHGKYYTVERFLPSGYVKLLGIEQPVSPGALTVLENVSLPELPANRFISKRYRLVEEVVCYENIPGNPELKELMLIDSTLVEEYSKGSIEVNNVSEWIQRNLGQ